MAKTLDPKAIEAERQTSSRAERREQKRRQMQDEISYNQRGMVSLSSRRKNGEKFYFMPETVRRAQALTRELMAKYGIPLENVVRHYDVTHKNCPEPFVESASAWTVFKQGIQKKEEPDMTEAEVKKIIESTRRTYNSVSAVPAGAKPTVEKLTRKGWLLGDEHGKLDLTEELLRTLVINDRAGIYGE